MQKKTNKIKRLEMRKNTKVSIIIPIYNMEKYLEECLDTAIGQTLKNIWQ